MQDVKNNDFYKIHHDFTLSLFTNIAIYHAHYGQSKNRL